MTNAMKSLRQFVLPLFLLTGVSAQAQVTLQTFSNVVDNNLNFFYGSWEVAGSPAGSVAPNSQFSQGIGVYNITGGAAIIPTNSADSKLEFFNASPSSIGSNTFISVTAQRLGGNAAGSFQIQLKDSNGNSAYAAFDTTLFSTSSYSLVTAALTMPGGFLPASIDSIIITGAQPGGTSAFSMSFDNIAATTAIPEPSTYAVLAGLGALGVAWVRRSRRTVSR